MDKKDLYKDQVKAKLKEFDAKTDVLKAKAEQASASAKIEYFEALEDIKAKRKQVQASLDELSRSSDEAWQDVKKGLEQSWNTFSRSVKKALSRFDTE